MVHITETRDYRLLAEMNEEVQVLHYELYPQIFKPYDKDAVAGFFKTALEKESATAYIAVMDDVVVGYVLLFVAETAENPFQYPRRFLVLDQLLVSKKCRANGIGKLLVEKAFLRAKALNVSSIELNHWTLNETARAFFKKNGFTCFNEKMWAAL